MYPLCHARNMEWNYIRQNRSLLTLQSYDEQAAIDWNSRKLELISILDAAKHEAERRESKYTAICGYSGGKDTAFTISYLTKELVIRC